MKKTEFLRQLSDVLGFDMVQQQENASLQGLGWDSMSTLSYMSFVDENFKIIISPKELNKVEFISDLFALIPSGMLED